MKERKSGVDGVLGERYKGEWGLCYVSVPSDLNLHPSRLWVPGFSVNLIQKPLYPADRLHLVRIYWEPTVTVCSKVSDCKHAENK